jgi:hypothetical protein
MLSGTTTARTAASGQAPLSIFNFSNRRFRRSNVNGKQTSKAHFAKRCESASMEVLGICKPNRLLTMDVFQTMRLLVDTGKERKLR